jgi:hypothetical protein
MGGAESRALLPLSAALHTPRYIYKNLGGFVWTIGLRVRLPEAHKERSLKQEAPVDLCLTISRGNKASRTGTGGRDICRVQYRRGKRRPLGL